MKKLFVLATLILASFALVACQEETTTTTTAENQAPVFSGVLAEVTIQQGESFAVLDGVTATDPEDGDLTDQITVTSIPTMVLVEGNYTPEDQGEYYITYSVIDSQGEETKEFTTLYVTQAVSEETLYKSYVFETSAEVDLDGWQASFSDGAAGTMAPSQGRLVFSVTALGTADYHAKLYKVDVAAVTGAEYTLKVTMSASQAAKMHFIINDASQGWSPVASVYNLEISTTPTTYELKYTVAADTNQIEYLLQMGGDLNTSAFDLFVDKVELITATGTETESELVNNDFTNATDADAWGIAQNEQATSSIAVVDGALVHTISNYAPEGAPWNINLYNATGINLVSGNKYKVTFDITVVNDQFYELCFEDSTMDWQVRAGFNNGTFSGTQHFEYTFFASMDITGLYIKLALGQGTTSNTITIDNFVFVELVGDKIEESHETVFMASTEDAEWGTYNANGGVGSIYTEDGSLFYSISAFGATDWYNKFYIKQITLEEGARYKIEFTVKADKDLKGFFALNVYGKWDPRITAEFDVSTEETTYTFTMDANLIIDMDFELLFQFGGYAENEAPALIEFTAINIYQLK